MSVMFLVCEAPGGLIFQYIRRIPSLYILSSKKPLGSWILVNPLLSVNEAWMDECAARLQPLVNQ